MFLILSNIQPYVGPTPIWIDFLDTPSTAGAFSLSNWDFQWAGPVDFHSSASLGQSLVESELNMYILHFFHNVQYTVFVQLRFQR